MTSPSLISALLASPAFGSIDRHFADFIQRLAGTSQSAQSREAAVLAAALVSRRLAEGQTCLPLAEVAGRLYPPIGAEGVVPVACPPLAEWEQLLHCCSVVGKPGEAKPLILDGSGRLYLQRYWSYERAVADDLRGRLNAPPMEFDKQALGAGLKRFFPGEPGAETNWQKLAAFAAVRQQFCILTGGPGTGKTYTIARLLALLLEQPGSDHLKIRLAAPTGKAVARLQESLRHSLQGLDCSPGIKARLQEKDLTSTIHRLLGTIPNSVHFRHNEDNPLSVDVLVVDEASMVSLPLMAKLLAALKPGVRLVLVGDKDQLPPVDPGSVLSDLCQAAAINRYSAAFLRDYCLCAGEVISEGPGTAASGLLDAVVQLRTNHRAGEASTLRAVSLAVNAGKTDDVIQLAGNSGIGESAFMWQELPQTKGLKDKLRPVVLQHYKPVLEAATPGAALAALDRFRILCAVREGPHGSLAINRYVEEILHEAGVISTDSLRFGGYRGKPVMITANNYMLKLFNGDTGVTWPNETGLGSLVHFPEEAGGTRAMARERLPEHETVFAMTVHKSQGSEFEHVLLLLPERDNPVLTRELVYTGLTRAKKSLSLLAPESVLRTAIGKRMQRASGLLEAMKE